MSHEISWHGTGRKATQPPNPDYPNGIDLGAVHNSGSLRVTCRVELPYPAECVGHWVITCRDCGMTVACTAAGRPDDPRSIIIACKTSCPKWSKR